MSENAIIIQVFNGAEGNCSTCTGGCQASGKGVQKVTGHIADILKERYGNKVTIEYVDIFAVNLNDYPQVIAAIKDGFDMPIITFNENPRLSSAINLEDIIKVLEEMGI